LTLGLVLIRRRLLYTDKFRENVVSHSRGYSRKKFRKKFEEKKGLNWGEDIRIGKGLQYYVNYNATKSLIHSSKQIKGKRIAKGEKGNT